MVAGFTCLTALGLVGAVGGAGATANPTLASCTHTIVSQEFAKGKLTVATDSLVSTPWFVNNRPSNAKGYESALVYALAKVLGVKRSNVTWVSEPFDASYTPGHKAFDFDIDEVSSTPERARAVTFSSSYFNVQQSIVALKTNPIVTKHSAAQLKTYQYGDESGTTGLTYINNVLKPTKPVRVYATLDRAIAALQSRQIDALVIDTPTGQYMASAQIVNQSSKPVATVVGQFPSVGEHYGLLFQKGNPLVRCVNVALSALKTNGTIAALVKKWLGLYTNVPALTP